MVNKTAALRFVNPLLGLLFVVQALTGIFHDAIPHDVYSVVHGYFGYAFAALVSTHLWLNWSWVKSLLKAKSVAAGSRPRPVKPGDNQESA